MQSSAIDTELAAAWKAQHVEPAPKVDDAGFLRRAYLDLAGRVPPTEAVDAFLADRTPDKRARLVDTLLANPLYADHFTNYWERVLLGREIRPNVDRKSFRDYLHQRLERNTRYDQLVYELVTATGANTAADVANGPPLNGATNWYLRYSDNPADLAGTTSRIFLGVQIQCAQCHDHKTEKWTMADFQHFTAAFTRTRAQAIDEKMKGVRPLEVKDIELPPRAAKKMGMNDMRDATPQALDGTDLSKGAPPRVNLARWMTGKQNPWFAKAITNRIWAHMLGRGFSEPIDDFRESNPSTLPELHQRIAADFVASNYDLKHLLRLIANSDAYQRASIPTDDKQRNEAMWSRFPLKRLGPDELLDSLLQATRYDRVLERGANVEQMRQNLRRQFAFLFDVDEETDHGGEFDGTITQALMTMNGNLFNKSAQAIPGVALSEILAGPGDDAAKIRALYLRTLSRPPTSEETAYYVAFVRKTRGLNATNKATPKEKAASYEDLFWALLNSSEFLFNH
jgi:hypothetical protein